MTDGPNKKKGTISQVIQCIGGGVHCRRYSRWFISAVQSHSFGMQMNTNRLDVMVHKFVTFTNYVRPAVYLVT